MSVKPAAMITTCQTKAFNDQERPQPSNKTFLSTPNQARSQILSLGPKIHF